MRGAQPQARSRHRELPLSGIRWLASRWSLQSRFGAHEPRGDGPSRRVEAAVALQVRFGEVTRRKHSRARRRSASLLPLEVQAVAKSGYGRTRANHQRLYTDMLRCI